MRRGFSQTGGVLTSGVVEKLCRVGVNPPNSGKEMRVAGLLILSSQILLIDQESFVRLPAATLCLIESGHD